MLSHVNEFLSAEVENSGEIGYSKTHPPCQIRYEAVLPPGVLFFNFFFQFFYWFKIRKNSCFMKIK
jgi:hypothetical protein